MGIKSSRNTWWRSPVQWQNVFVQNTYQISIKHRKWKIFSPEWIDADIKTIEDFISLFFPSLSPEISLSSSPDNFLREKWVDVVNPTIYFNIEPWSNPDAKITKIELYRNWDKVYEWTDNSYTDWVSFSNTTKYNAIVYDELNRTWEWSLTYEFVYPFFWGVVNDWDVYDWITEDDLDDVLGKYVVKKWTHSFASSPDNQKYCFAYPKEYWQLSAIIDQNWFNTIDDYDLNERTVKDMLDWTDQKYYFYILKDPTTQSDFTNTYIF